MAGVVRGLRPADTRLATVEANGECLHGHAIHGDFPRLRRTTAGIARSGRCAPSFPARQTKVGNHTLPAPNDTNKMIG